MKSWVSPRSLQERRVYHCKLDVLMVAEGEGWSSGSRWDLCAVGPSLSPLLDYLIPSCHCRPHII